MAVESRAREAHDRDLAVNAIGDCCIAANDADQHRSPTNMKKLASVISSAELTLDQAIQAADSSQLEKLWHSYTLSLDIRRERALLFMCWN